MAETSAIVAARKLAKELDLPKSKGSVFAWFDNGRHRIVVRADKTWLRNHRSLPGSYMGFPVEADDPSDPMALN